MSSFSEARTHDPAATACGAAVAFADLVLTVTDPGRAPITVIDQPGTMSIAAGERVGLAGASGSGKTMLLHALTGLVKPASGRITVGGCDVWALSPAERDRWRARSVGLVFQDFHLVPELGVLQNILLPTTFRALSPPRDVVARARSLIDGLGLADGPRRAAKLSRGEQQRVAIARALLQAPPLLVADEPTASLDRAASRNVAEMLVEQARATGATLIVSSHDPTVLGLMDRVIAIEDARLVARSGP